MGGLRDGDGSKVQLNCRLDGRMGVSEGNLGLLSLTTSNLVMKHGRVQSYSVLREGTLEARSARCIYVIVLPRPH